MSEQNHLDHDWFPRRLPSGVVIGERSWCYSTFAFLHYQSLRLRGVRIGRNTGIYNGTFFDLGPDAQVEIGDYCTLVGAIIATNGHVVIGDYAFLSHEVVLAGQEVMQPSMPSDGDAVKHPPIVLGANTWIGARAVLLGGAQVGEGAIIGAAAVVHDIISPYTIAAGNPARMIGCVPSRR